MRKHLMFCWPLVMGLFPLFLEQPRSFIAYLAALALSCFTLVKGYHWIRTGSRYFLSREKYEDWDIEMIYLFGCAVLCLLEFLYSGNKGALAVTLLVGLPTGYVLLFRWLVSRFAKK